MNKAAEKAAPKATEFFVDAIKEMSFEDAGKILNGGDTAATEYLREKTSNKIYGAFKPIISASVDEVGVTHSYKEMMSNFKPNILKASGQNVLTLTGFSRPNYHTKEKKPLQRCLNPNDLCLIRKLRLTMDIDSQSLSQNFIQLWN